MFEVYVESHYFLRLWSLGLCFCLADQYPVNVLVVVGVIEKGIFVSKVWVVRGMGFLVTVRLGCGILLNVSCLRVERGRQFLIQISF